MTIKRLLKKHSTTIMGVFIILILLFSTLSFVMNSAPTSSKDSSIKVNKNGDMVIENEGFYIEVNHLPSELEGMYENSYDFQDEDIFLAFYSNSPNQTEETKRSEQLKNLQAKLSVLGTSATIACVGECSSNKIDCEYFENVVVIKESDENNYYQKNNCHYFETTDIEKLSDYILYKTKGLIK